jgi:hypothetical protein
VLSTDELLRGIGFQAPAAAPGRGVALAAPGGNPSLGIHRPAAGTERRESLDHDQPANALGIPGGQVVIIATLLQRRDPNAASA